MASRSYPGSSEMKFPERCFTAFSSCRRFPLQRLLGLAIFSATQPRKTRIKAPTVKGRADSISLQQGMPAQACRCVSFQPSPRADNSAQTDPFQSPAAATCLNCMTALSAAATALFTVLERRCSVSFRSPVSASWFPPLQGGPAACGPALFNRLRPMPLTLICHSLFQFCFHDTVGSSGHSSPHRP